jgi:hypothetical protein
VRGGGAQQTSDGAASTGTLSPQPVPKLTSNDAASTGTLSPQTVTKSSTNAPSPPPVTPAEKTIRAPPLLAAYQAPFPSSLGR